MTRNQHSATTTVCLRAVKCREGLDTDGQRPCDANSDAFRNKVLIDAMCSVAQRVDYVMIARHLNLTAITD